MSDTPNSTPTGMPSIPQSLFNWIPDEKVLEVRGAHARQTPTMPIVFLDLITPFHLDTETVHCYGLSLPAAARLARMLDKAVQDNLYGPEIED